MVHDGPGLSSVVSKHCETVEQWHQIDHPPSLANSKLLYIANFGRSRVHITPYFLQHPYRRLHDQFRDLLQQFTLAKDDLEPPNDDTPGVELDFFPQFDAVYERVLTYFDAAILELQPKVPKVRSIPRAPTRIQPERPGKRSLDAGDNLPPTKRPRVGLDRDLARTKMSKTNMLSNPPPRSKPIIPRYARPLPSNVRRSERLKSRLLLIPTNSS